MNTIQIDYSYMFLHFRLAIHNSNQNADSLTAATAATAEWCMPRAPKTDSITREQTKKPQAKNRACLIYCLFHEEHWLLFWFQFFSGFQKICHIGSNINCKSSRHFLHWAYRKDTEHLYHAFVYSLIILLSSIYPFTQCLSLLVTIVCYPYI